MSAVFLHVGQCGNQIGKAFWKKTSQDKAVHEGQNQQYWTKSPKDTASITVASNSESIIEYLETVYERSRVKFAAKAYLHWYNKYGVTNEDFEEAFDVVEDIIQNYKSSFS